MKGMILFFSFFLCLLGVTLPCHGEIIDVTVSWNPQECDASCSQFLEKVLTQIPQVRKVEINQGTGYADLYWRPLKNFTIDMVRYPMHRLGLKMQGIGVEAKGTISHSGNRYFLHSLGDSTILELLSPTQTSTSKMVIEANPANHIVREPLKSQLLEFEKNEQLVTAKGNIFMPQRSELKLVVDSVKLAQ